MSAYPRFFGTTSATTVSPAIRSPRSQPRSYDRTQPTIGTNATPCRRGFMGPPVLLAPSSCPGSLRPVGRLDALRRKRHVEQLLLSLLPDQQRHEVPDAGTLEVRPQALDQDHHLLGGNRRKLGLKL